MPGVEEVSGVMEKALPPHCHAGPPHPRKSLRIDSTPWYSAESSPCALSSGGKGVEAADTPPPPELCEPILAKRGVRPG